MTTYGEKATAADPDAKPISVLFVNCSLRLRNFGQPGAAASDNCNHLADSGVELDNGNIMWRCARHRGIRSIHPAADLGPVHTHIIVRSS